MSDIKLFRRQGDTIIELTGRSATVEKWLQTLIENHMETFLGVRFLATEYTTGKAHGGRIDSLGIDENNYPVIIEYKRRTDENVINQGLFYLDWLMDHQAEFQLSVQEKFGLDTSIAIDWSGPRLLCIASDFTKYDEHAVAQIDRNIELIRYRLFGKDLILFELVNRSTSGSSKKFQACDGPETQAACELASLNGSLKPVYEALREFILALGEDVEERPLKLYVAFRRLKNFVCVVPGKTKNSLWLYIRMDPQSVALEDGFSRDVRDIGHWGTGDLEVQLRTLEDLEKAKPLIERSYHNS
jgi:predicted transport protein